MKDLIAKRIVEAKAALDEAGALREAGMDIGFVLNNLYLAFYYPVIALVYEGKVPDAMQSVVIGLFEERFVRTGRIEAPFGDAVRRVFELKPRCSGGSMLTTPDELDRLFGQAGPFIFAVEALSSRS